MKVDGKGVGRISEELEWRKMVNKRKLIKVRA